MNKIKIIIITIFLLYGFSTYTQILGNFGVKAGILFNGLNSSDNAPPNLQDSSSFNFFSYDAAIYAEFFPSKNLNITTEFHFTMLGEHPPNLIRLLTKIPSNQGEFYEYKYASNRFNYISLQVLPHYNFLNTVEDRLYILAGPRFDLMVGNYNSSYSNNIKLKNGNLEIGSIIGFGGEFRNIFNFEIRYNYNFSEAYSVIFGTEKVTRKHNSFTFLAGVSFRKLLKIDF